MFYWMCANVLFIRSQEIYYTMLGGLVIASCRSRFLILELALQKEIKVKLLNIQYTGMLYVKKKEWKDKECGKNRQSSTGRFSVWRFGIQQFDILFLDERFK